MDQNWLIPDLLLDLKLEGRHYIYREHSEGEPVEIIDVDNIQNYEDITKMGEVNIISPSSLTVEEHSILLQQFGYRGNRVIGDNWENSNFCTLLLPTELCTEVFDFLEKKDKSHVSVPVLLYLTCITQYTYWFILTHQVADYNFLESLKAIRKLKDARSITVNADRDYPIKDKKILNNLKQAINWGLKSIDTWEYWEIFIQRDMIDEDLKSPKILQPLALGIDQVLSKLYPNETANFKNILTGYILAWANLPIKRKGIGIDKDDRDEENLRKWASGLKERASADIELNGNCIPGTDIRSRTTSDFEYNLKNIIDKYNLGDVESNIREFLVKIPHYQEQYPDLKLKLSIATLSKIIPNYSKLVKSKITDQINDLLIEPVKLLPFDLIKHVFEFDLSLKVHCPSSRERHEIIAMLLSISEVFINNPKSIPVAANKIDFWLSLVAE